MVRLGADALIADISFAGLIPKDVEESVSRQNTPLWRKNELERELVAVSGLIVPVPWL